MFMMQKETETNVYSSLEKNLRDNILCGVIDYKKPIRGENELAKKYGISRKSVRKAIDNLAKQGLLIKKKGAGTFVIPPGRRVRKPQGIFLKIIFVSPYYENARESEFEQSLFDGAEEYCVRCGHRLEFSGMKLSVEDISRSFILGEISGLIWNLPPLDICGKTIEALKKAGVPQITIQRECGDVSSVFSDSGKALSDCLGFLKSIGHRKITFVNWDTMTTTSLERKEAYLKSMKMLGLDGVKYYLSPSTYSDAGKFNAIAKMKNPPTAIVLGGHGFLPPFLAWADGNSVRVPQDISLICLDDSTLARISRPSISVYCEPRNEMGKRAVQLLEDSIWNRVLPGEKTRISGNLIMRESCALPRKSERISGL